MKTLVYLRLSHLESDNFTSFETQEKKCRAYAELHELNVTKVISEVLSGGTPFKKRKVFQKHFEELSKGDALITSRLDRLGRSTYETLSLVEECKKRGIDIHITDLGNVCGNGVGKIFFTILNCLAEVERLQASERVRTQKLIAKKDRKYLGGGVEFGYSRDENGKLIPNPKEIEIIKSAFNLRRQKLSYEKIADVITRKHHRKIHKTQIFRILNREHNQSIIAA